MRACTFVCAATAWPCQHLHNAHCRAYVNADLLDVDGDGEVTKLEFKTFFMRIHKQMSEKEFEKIWRDIDSNGDGILQLGELCDYYGVDTDSVEDGVIERREMPDDKILEALALQTEVCACRCGHASHATHSTLPCTASWAVPTHPR